MSRRHLPRVGLPILALAATALLGPAGAIAAPPPPPPFPDGVIVGSPDKDTLIGTWRGEVIFGLAEDDLILGGPGADRIFGGPGADRIRGGFGQDTIRGGLGADHISGGPGNDLIFVAGDGAIDTVTCGDGRQDLVVVDPDDVVDADCEFVWVRDPEA